MKIGIIVNIVPVVAYGVCLIIFACQQPMNNQTTETDTIYEALSVLIIAIWSLQIISFSLLLYSTVRIRRLITNNTQMARLIDKKSICLTLMMVVLVLVMYCILYTILVWPSILDPTLTPYNYNEDYLYAAVAAVVAFIA